MLTPSATRFVGPLSFAALSRHPVETELLDLLPDGRIGHIVVADTADAIVVAPATAHWLGAMANGLAGDVVTATCLATAAPVVVAPAMDGDMWTHPATAANVAPAARRLRLRDRRAGGRAARVGPVRRRPAGRAADDRRRRRRGRRRAPGPRRRPGRPPAPRRPRPATPTSPAATSSSPPAAPARPIDPVRFIGNRSTGKMGVAIAEAALDRGARVTLIAANVEVPLPATAAVVRVESTADMRAALLRSTHASDAIRRLRRPRHGRRGRRLPADRAGRHASSSAADRPDARARADPGPPGRGRPDRPRPDADGAAAREPLRPVPILVGFAAETGSLERAAEKLRRKGVDLLVANDVAEAGSGFGTDTNRVVDPGRRRLARRPAAAQSKREVAERLLDRVAGALDERDAAAQTGRDHDRAREGASMSATPETVRRLTVVDIARLYADGAAHRDADRLRLPDRAAPRRGRHPAAPRRRLARPGHARLRDDRPGHDGRDAPPHQGRRPRHVSGRSSSATCRSSRTRRPTRRSRTPAASCARRAPRRSRSRAACARARIIETLVRAGIPVMGHIGLTPQTINAIGKVRVQGKTRDQARALLADALAVQEAGAFAHRPRARPRAARGGHHRAAAHPDDRDRRRRRAAAARSRSSPT